MTIPGGPAVRHMAEARLTVTGLRGIPLVEAGDDLAAILVKALAAADVNPADGDVLVVTQKIVSKAEGGQIPLDRIEPSPRAVELAAETGKDPRLVQLILDESTEVVRKAPGVLITRSRLGLVCANAGIDQSNLDHGQSATALVLPTAPDATAARLQRAISARIGTRIGVLISDSSNRPWRLGTVGIAIGAAGLTVLDDRRGSRDLYGRDLYGHPDQPRRRHRRRRGAGDGRVHRTHPRRPGPGPAAAGRRPRPARRTAHRRHDPPPRRNRPVPLTANSHLQAATPFQSGRRPKCEERVVHVDRCSRRPPRMPAAARPYFGQDCARVQAFGGTPTA